MVKACVFNLNFPCVFLFFQIAVYLSDYGRRLIKVTDEGSAHEIAQYDTYHLPLNGFTASKGSYI